MLVIFLRPKICVLQNSINSKIFSTKLHLNFGGLLNKIQNLLKREIFLLIMGRIKTKAIKRASIRLIARVPEIFGEEFEHNKKVLGNTTMPSKKVRNMTAGYITRLKRNNKKILSE